MSTSTTPPIRARRRMLVMLLATGLFLGLLVGFNQYKGIMLKRAMAGQGEPAQTVTTVEARLEPWQPSLGAVGTVRAIRGADLALEVPGVLARVLARPGSEVSEGQPLAALDDSAEAAQLSQLQAMATLSELTCGRARQQFAARAISQADLDQAEADCKAKRAGVQAQAAQLAKKHLAAPFSGRVGLVAVSQGGYLQAGAPVLTLQQLDPVYVDFLLPQKELARIRPGQPVTLTVDAYPGRSFPGKVTAVNPKVDGSTRNVQVQATCANPGRGLLPGMFTRVTLDAGAAQEQLTLPQTAVNHNPYGSVVFLAKAGPGGLVAEQVFVTTGATRGDQVAILKGLHPGALVVSSGGHKLRNGTPLRVDNRRPPADDADPAPQEE